MKLKERDEKKRSTLWRVVITGTTLVILLVVGYFLTNMMKGNPIEGEWYAEDKGYHLVVEDEELVVKGDFDGEEKEYRFEYKLNKSDKTITIKKGSNLFGTLSEEEGWTDDETTGVSANIPITFEYDLGRKTITLREREYGHEFIFTKQ